MTADGGTAMGDGLARGLAAAQTPVPTEDGARHAQAPGDHRAALRRQEHRRRRTTRSRSRAQAAAAKIPVYTIALGTEAGEVVQQDPFGFEQRIPVPPDKETLRRIAQLTGGRFFEAVSADDAEPIYERIGTRLTSKPEKREVTVAFAGGAFVLLLAGGALGLGWFGRPL